jgi:hypothetical protein
MAPGWIHRAEVWGRRVGEQLGRLLDRLLRPGWSSDTTGAAEALILEMEVALEQAVDPRLTFRDGQAWAPCEMELRLPFEVASRFEGARWTTLRARLEEHLGEFLRNRRCRMERSVRITLEVDPFLRRFEVRFPLVEDPSLPRGQSVQLIDQRTQIVHALQFLPGADVIGVGRNPANGVVLDDPTVSSFHAALRWRPQGRFELADCGGINGTRINGVLLPEGGARTLEDGDLLSVGEVELRCLIDPGEIGGNAR